MQKSRNFVFFATAIKQQFYVVLHFYSNSYRSFVAKVSFLQQFCAPKCTLAAVSRTSFQTNAIKCLKNSQKSTQDGRWVQKRPRHGKHYKPAVKVTIASTLCTRVRARVLFQKRFQRKRFSCEHVSKLSRFSGELLNLSGVLHCIF